MLTERLRDLPGGIGDLAPTIVVTLPTTTNMLIEVGG